MQSNLTEEQFLDLVWQKGNVVITHDPRHARQDDYGRWMVRAEYGNRRSDWGWEMDHKIPASRGGSDALGNLRPLNWRSNVERGNGWA